MPVEDRLENHLTEEELEHCNKLVKNQLLKSDITLKVIRMFLFCGEHILAVKFPLIDQLQLCHLLILQ